jgi:hypothetical protein
LGKDRNLSDEFSKKLKGQKIYRFLISIKADDETSRSYLAYVGQSRDFLKRIEGYRAGTAKNSYARGKLRDAPYVARLTQAAKILKAQIQANELRLGLTGHSAIKQLSNFKL